MTRPERGFDDRAVPEDRFHIGAPAPGRDIGRRRQYAEGGACVDACARNVLGGVDSTPIHPAGVDSDDTRIQLAPALQGWLWRSGPQLKKVPRDQVRQGLSRTLLAEVG